MFSVVAVEFFVQEALLSQASRSPLPSLVISCTEPGNRPNRATSMWLRCDFNEFYSNSFNSTSKILVGIRVAQFAIRNWGVAVRAFDRSHWAAVCRISVAMHACDGCGLPSPTSHGTGNGFCSLSCSDVVSIINADTLSLDSLDSCSS